MSKKIFPSSGNGKGAESSVVTVDENNGNVSAASVTASYITVDGLNGLAKISSGQISNLDLSTAQSGNILQSQGGQFIAKAASLQALGGDLDGLLSNATVISIANVTSGTLTINVGGTAKNSLTSGSILALNQSNIDATSGSLLTVNNAGNAWQATGSALLDVVPLTGALIYLYTGSLNFSNNLASSSTFMWTKPVGARFIRVICQGAGGGGGGAAGGGDGGSGGGGGGYSDIILNGATFPNTPITCSVGNGGYRGSPGTLALAGTGGNTSFGNYLIAYGGTGGINDTAANNNTVGIGGIGYTNQGGNGAIAGAGAGDIGQSVIRAGAGGGSGAGTNAYLPGGAGGSVTAYGASGGSGGASISQSGGNASGVYSFKFKNFVLNNEDSTEFPRLIYGGGGGGASANSVPGAAGGAGGSPYFGSGGGGAGMGAGSNGGYGGRGYVLIICY